ncbi:DELLA protein RGL1 [Striga hermonthica]|uniref:DELLA protein n=1 Tax=Striga hermonthica TaxID=68872 RepID=A0A9N7NLI3_STRHE|nr:DELLA protein RGL1 [Striga hermonthica]
MASASGSTTIVTAAGKAKTVEDKPDSAGMDELFAVLGYKLKSSDMADVAEKLEQLEMALATTTEQDGASVLSTDTVHYNPSDISGWVDTMLSDITTSCGCGFEIGNIPGESSSGNHNTTGSSRTDGERRRVTYDGDLSAIPGGAVLQSGANKRMRISAGFLENVSPPVTAARPFVVDSQETGVRLVHALTACGEAVQQGNMKLADALVQHVSVLAVSQGGAMGKVATYFAAALAQIIYGIGFSQLDPLQLDLLQMHFYETTPYLKFAHFTANQAILEAFAGSDRVEGRRACLGEVRKF